MRKIFWLSIACLLVFVVVACTPQPVSTPKVLPKSISYGSLPAPASVYVTGVALGSVLKKYAGLELNVEPVGPGKAQMDRMRTKEVELGQFDSFTVSNGYWGEDIFKEDGPQDIRLIQSVHLLRFAVVTRPDTGIKSIPDLRGKRVHCIWPGTMGTPMGLAYLGAYGMNHDDIKALKYSSIGEYTKELIEGKTDAFIGNAGVRANMEEIERSVGAYIVPLPHEPKIMDSIKKSIPSAAPFTFPRGYPGAKEETPSVGVPFYFYCRADLDEDLIYLIVKTLIEHHEELKTMHPDLVEWTLESATKWVAIPFHPGSIKYYKEKGVWSNELEELQKKLLARKK